MSEPGPIHPALGPLARAAKAFGKTLRTTNVAPGGLVETLRDAVARDRSWLPGQRSPVHGHYVWCAYGIVEGELTEEQFRAPGELLEPLGSKTIRAGELAELDLGGPLYHRVSNHGVRPVLSLHLYGVASGLLTTGINRIYAEE